MVPNGSLRCCDHETVEFKVLKNAQGIPKTLGCERMDTDLART